MANKQNSKTANQKAIPLNVTMERTRTQLVQAFNQVMSEARLPAYLLEGILEGILADVRSQKNAELVAAMSAEQQSAEPEAADQ